MVLRRFRLEIIFEIFWYNVLPYVTLALDDKMPAYRHRYEVRNYMTETDLVDPFKIVGIKRQRIHEPVAEQIRQAIFSGLIGPGHKLPAEREMAESFHTSRVALRARGHAQDSTH